jgi:hypothetical protein
MTGAGIATFRPLVARSVLQRAETVVAADALPGRRLYRIVLATMPLPARPMDT